MWVLLKVLRWLLRVERDHRTLVLLFDPKQRLERPWDDAAVRKLELGGAAGENWSGRCSLGSYIEPRVPAHADNHLEPNQIKDL
jgi:hypothetical protein